MCLSSCGHVHGNTYSVLKPCNPLDQYHRGISTLVHAFIVFSKNLFQKFLVDYALFQYKVPPTHFRFLARVPGNSIQQLVSPTKRAGVRLYMVKIKLKSHPRSYLATGGCFE